MSLLSRHPLRGSLSIVVACVLVVGASWIAKETVPVFNKRMTPVVAAPLVVAEVDQSFAPVVQEPVTSTQKVVPEIVTVVPTSTEIRLLFVGDIMLDRNVAVRSRAAHDLGYPFRHLPPGWIASFDYAIANLEGPVTAVRRPPEKSIDFQFDPAVIPVLKEQGFDAFSQANNHALDQGRQGYGDSVTSLRKADFLVFGHQVQDDEIALATTTIKGKTFAFVGWNTTDNPIDLEAAAKVLVKARAEADYVIAVMHWGAEYQDHPIPSVVSLADWLVAHGVDVVIGGHPHWVQGISQLGHTAGHPIIYSLGNFVFDQDFSEKTKEGLAIGLTFRDRSVKVEPFPLRIEKSQPRVLVGAERDRRLDALADISDVIIGPSIGAGSIDYSLEELR